MLVCVNIVHINLCVVKAIPNGFVSNRSLKNSITEKIYRGVQLKYVFSGTNVTSIALLPVKNLNQHIAAAYLP